MFYLLSKKVDSIFQKCDDIAEYIVKNHEVNVLLDVCDQEVYKLLPANLEDKKKQTEFLMTVSVASLAVAIVSNLFFPSLGFLSIPVVLYTSITVLKRTFSDLAKGKIGVDALASMILIVCIASNYFVVMNLANVSYCASFMMIEKVRASSHQQVTDIFKEHPTFVWLMKDEVEIRIPFEDIELGNILVFQAGEVIAVDGSIVDGFASIDQHILTGESQPAEKQSGDDVFASTLVLSGKVYVEVRSTGQETIVAKIGKILNNTSGFKTSQELRAEKLTNQTVIPTLAVSCAAMPFVGPYGSVAILNAHFKYRMGIVSPISILSFLDVYLQHGILIKEGQTLDFLGQVDTVVFDKTGTLTEERPSVTTIYTFEEYSENDILLFAATAEQKQSHPIAQAILNEFESRNLEPLKANQSECKVGYGVAIHINDKVIRVGSLRYMKLSEVSILDDIRNLQETCEESGNSLVMIAEDDKLIGAIELSPTIRANAKEVIENLKSDYGIKETYIISGDSEAPTKKLAEELNIDKYYAKTLPEDKANIIKNLQDEGKFVCYIGDGINDAIALKQSQVSISLRGASSVAQDTAQILLMEADLKQLEYLFAITKDFKKNADTCFKIILSSTAVGIGSVVFLNLGLVTTIVVGYGSLAMAVGTALLPRKKKYKKDSLIEKKESQISKV